MKTTSSFYSDVVVVCKIESEQFQSLKTDLNLGPRARKMCQQSSVHSALALDFIS